MTSQTIVLTSSDQAKLEELIAAGRTRRQVRDKGALDELAREVARALIVSPNDIPSNVVTMDSVVDAVDLETNEPLRLTVSWPEDSDFESGRVNVLAPLGMALLGASEGSEVEWPVPDGKRRIRLTSVVYQPESGSGSGSHRAQGLSP